MNSPSGFQQWLSPAFSLRDSPAPPQNKKRTSCLPFSHFVENSCWFVRISNTLPTWRKNFQCGSNILPVWNKKKNAMPSCQLFWCYNRLRLRNTTPHWLWKEKKKKIYSLTKQNSKISNRHWDWMSRCHGLRTKKEDSERQGRSGLDRLSPPPQSGVHNHPGTAHQRRALEDRQINQTEQKKNIGT